MIQTPQKRNLPTYLSHLHKKRMAIVFKGLVLFNQDPEQETTVGHYDHQYEGIVMLVGVFKKKMQAVMMRALNNIKVTTLTSKKRQTNTENKELPESTRRTNLMTSHAMEEVNSMRIQINKPIKQNRKQNSENSLNLSNNHSSHSRLEGILSRLKLVNSMSQFPLEKMKCERLNAENSTFYIDDSRYRQPLYRTKTNSIWQQNNMKKVYSTQQLSAKHSKRQYIMNKLSKIQTQLSALDAKKPLHQYRNNQIQNETFNFRQQLHTIYGNKLY